VGRGGGNEARKDTLSIDAHATLGIMIQKTETEAVREEARTFLQGHKKMILTILDKEGHPNSSLLLYAIEDFTVYFGTRKAFGKYQALKTNPHVAVAVVQEGIDPLQVLDMQGVAEELSGSEMKGKLEWFTKVNDAKYYVKDAEDYVMFRIKPYCIRWLDAMSGDLQVCDISVA
jgi:general stress protein 26